MKLKNISQKELQWQAEEDARMMARYEELMADNTRKQRAIKEAKRMAKDLKDRAGALEKVSSRK